MNTEYTLQGLIALIPSPVFSGKDQQIHFLNPAAAALGLAPGMDILPLVKTGREEYQSFSQGALCLTLDIGGKVFTAAVTMLENEFLFVLSSPSEDEALQALALAARQLREPLSSLMLSMNRLDSTLTRPDTSAREDIARLNRGLYQLLRLVGNMSDANAMGCHPELIDLSAFFSELVEKAQYQLSLAGRELHYQGLDEKILSLADPEQLERALWNLISNAVKFAAQPGPVTIRLTRKNRLLSLQITNPGGAMAQDIYSALFHRYRRSPGMEERRIGLGLGLVLVRAAAADHGGTVLIDQPTPDLTRITMTLAIRQSGHTQLCSPLLRVDYTGERDHALVELSDILPLSAYLPD